MLPITFAPVPNGSSSSRTPSFSTAASQRLKRLRGTSNATMPMSPPMATLQLPNGLHSPTTVSLVPSTNGSSHVNGSAKDTPALTLNRFQTTLIEVVTKRIKQSLPYYSGRDLSLVEADEPTKQAVDTLVELSRTHAHPIARQLVEILQSFEKQLANGLERKLYVQVLQSQLLLLKILDVTLGFNWHTHRTAQLGLSFIPQTSAASMDSTTTALYAQGNHPSTIAHDAGTPWIEPPPMEDNLAAVAVRVVANILRRSRAEGGSDLSFHDFEMIEAAAIITPDDSLNASTTSVQKTKSDGGSATGSDTNSTPTDSRKEQDPWSIVSKPFGLRPTYFGLLDKPESLHTVILKFASRLLFTLSAANWTSCYTAFRTHLGALVSQPDAADLAETRVMAAGALDRAKLIQILHDIANVLPAMKREKRPGLAKTITTAITNWIDTRPQEYRESSINPRAMGGIPERIFDDYYRILDDNNRLQLWPALSALLSISPERILQAEKPSGGFAGLFSKASTKRPSHYLDTVTRGLQSKSTTEASLSAIHALCRAAIHIPPNEGNVAIRALAPDLAEALRKRLMEPPPPLKPFYESNEPVNLEVISNAMVTIFRFDPQRARDTVFVPCLQPERSDGTKCCAIRAIITLATEAPRLQYQESLSILYNAIAPLGREIFRESGMRDRTEMPDGRINFVASKPPRVKTNDKLTSDRELLVLAVLTMWRMDFSFFFSNFTYEAMRSYQYEAGPMVLMKDSTLVHSSVARTFSSMFNTALKYNPGDFCFEGGTLYLTVALPSQLEFASDMFMNARDNPRMQYISTGILLSPLTSYGDRNVMDVSGWKESPARQPGFAAANIALLVALVSHNPEVTGMAAQALQCLANAEMNTENHELRPAYLSHNELNLRWTAYRNLIDPTNAAGGRVAQQKRFRRQLQNVAFVDGSNLLVWLECYRSWCTLKAHVTAAPDSLPKRRELDTRTLDDIKNEWHNLSLFLASFCACCDTDLPISDIAFPMLLDKFMDGRRQFPSPPKEMLRQFINAMGELLHHENTFARDTARDALLELHSSAMPILCPMVQQSLQTNLSQMDWQPARVLFAQQMLDVLKAILSYSLTAHAQLSLDAATLVTLLVNFLSRADGSETAFRVRMSFCQFVESAWSRRNEFAPMRHEGTVSAEVLDKVFEWAATAQSAALTATGPALRLYLDCELAALKACVTLLQGHDLASTNAKRPSSHTPTVLFHRYSSILLAALNTGEKRTQPSNSIKSITSTSTTARGADSVVVKDLIVQGLFHMLSSSGDVSSSLALELCFSDDINKRIVCVQVFSLLMRQGTRLEVVPSTSALSPHLALCKEIKSATPLVALSICACAPEEDADSLISVLLRVCYTSKTSLALMKAIIDSEIKKSVLEQFRNNPPQVRLLSLFAKLQCEEYLRQLINPVVEQMASVPTAQYETDVRRIGNYLLDDNLTNLETMTQFFLDKLYRSVDMIPPVIKEICSYIYHSMSHAPPEEQLIPVISFFFLRVVSPGLAQPTSVGVDLPVVDAISRGLVLIAKTIQSFANATPRQLANLVEVENHNVVAMVHFCRTLVSDTMPEGQGMDITLAAPYDESDGLVLHRFLHMHSAQVSRYFTELAVATGFDESEHVKMCNTISGILLELGKPAELLSAAVNAREHTAYREFVSRYSHRNMETVREIFVKLLSPKHGRAIFGLFVSRLNLNMHDIELLIAHTLSNSNLHKCKFDIVVDLSGFDSNSEVPLPFWMHFLRLLPADLLARLNRIFLVNSNFAAQRYLRRVHYASIGLNAQTEIIAVTSFQDLEMQLPELDVQSVSASGAMDAESRETFDDITFQQVPQPPARATLELALTHLRIVSKRPQQIWPGVSCRVTEIVTLAELGQLFSMTASAEDEFVLRPTMGPPLFIRSSNISQIVNAIRTASAKARSWHPAPPVSSRVETTTGTVLIVALVAVTHRNDEFRLAALNLLHDVSNFLGLRDLPILPVKGGLIPFNPTAIAIDFARRLSMSFPELSLDILQAFCNSVGNFDPELRAVATQLVNGWVKNLNMFMDANSPHFDADGDRIRKTVRMLVEMTVQQEAVYSLLQRHVWFEIGRLDTGIINIVLDECIAVATSAGIGSRTCTVIADTLVSLCSLHTRGKIISHLRKSFSRHSAVNCKTLQEESAWHQLAALARLTLVSFHHGRFPYHIQMFVPELVHAIVVVSCHSSGLLRKTMHDLTANLVAALQLARADDFEAVSALSAIGEELLTPEVRELFGLRQSAVSDGPEVDIWTAQDHVRSINGLVPLLNRVIEHAATGQSPANVWRARWMSLITSTAMHMWPALQSRAFLTYSCLVEDVEEAFVAHFLDFLRLHLGNDEYCGKPEVGVVLHALTRVASLLPEESLFLPQLFWVAAGILASTCDALYVEAASLMSTVLAELDRRGAFDHGLETALLEARSSFFHAFKDLEDLLYISFNSSFSFAMSLIIFRGARNQLLRDSAQKLLRTLLRLSVQSSRPRPASDSDYPTLDKGSLAYVLALLSWSTTPAGIERLLEDAGVGKSWLPLTEAEGVCGQSAPPVLPLAMLGISDARTAILHVSFLVSMMPGSTGDTAERDMMLRLLSDTATPYPQLVSLACRHALSSNSISLDESITSIFASNSPNSMASAMTLLRLALGQTGLTSSKSSIGATFAMSTMESLHDEMSIRSSELPTLLETHSMDGMLNVKEQWLAENVQLYQKVLPVVSDMLTAMLERHHE
ncbi:hypothetical protein BKA62DRAFT_794260 [Auriculariales sp. MPI-PUGE-AT-0066]|nr:hypothetical protein BKA62DRAFT_794260 [Auriculariales sp. MPI-PUGE-AT-0066]